jgi:hypothetical protein
MIKIMDTSNNTVELNDEQTDFVFSIMSGTNDPRISSCVNCHSCVIVAEPFNDLLDEINISRPDQSDLIHALIDLVEGSESVHLYIWEENDCAHVLWRDPLAAEWSDVTGEKRLHH